MKGVQQGYIPHLKWCWTVSRPCPSKAWPPGGGQGGGDQVVGVYTSCPPELIRACRGPAGGPVRQAQDLSPRPRPTARQPCPLIKSSSLPLTATCPFFMASDVVLGETLRRQEENVRGPEPPQAGAPMHCPHRRSPRPGLLAYGDRGLMAFLQEPDGQEITPLALRGRRAANKTTRRLLGSCTGSTPPGPAGPLRRICCPCESRNPGPTWRTTPAASSPDPAVEAYNAAGRAEARPAGCSNRQPPSARARTRCWPHRGGRAVVIAMENLHRPQVGLDQGPGGEDLLAGLAPATWPCLLLHDPHQGRRTSWRS